MRELRIARGCAMSRLNVALCGNPNVGKSTVFNALTGLRQHTGNWAGKTVESARGQVRCGDDEWTLIDLPGAYSLLTGSPEEVVASDYLAYQTPDVAVAVCDATCLERNLNIALQAAQLCPRVVLCVNMMDEARKRGIRVDLEKLGEVLQMPVVGVSAGKGQGLNELKRKVAETAESAAKSIPDLINDGELQAALEVLSPMLAEAVPALSENGSRFSALRLLAGGEAQLAGVLQNAVPEARDRLDEILRLTITNLRSRGLSCERVAERVISGCYMAAEAACRAAVSKPETSEHDKRRLRLDKLICDKRVGVPIMLALLALVLAITIWGANMPSQWLSETLLGFEPVLLDTLRSINAPEWLALALTEGLYRVMAWVVSVMLPPMAIFFPLFTLLEDWGFLPRVAFNLDKCFRCCRACGKQSLCMLQGLGCNAVGVMGCRIIQSPRERVIAILTNAMMPCNGRFPTLIMLIGMFFVAANGLGGTIASALALLALIVLGVLMTFLSSWMLSRTLLRGLPSAFSLELPPFRRPKIGQVLVRSVLDRTLFVLGRAVSVAAPTGLLLWLLANLHIDGEPVLRLISGFIDPIGRFFGMDGVLLLAFVLGFPANEIVLPIAMMIYLSQGALTEAGGLEALKLLLVSNGWTVRTAVCASLFSLFHWPCSTTLITIYKETKSRKWTVLAALLPTAIGCSLCALAAFVSGLF